MTEQPVTVRCAIYTRKSTEEGLAQEFNTLQAQREAAEACILSHRQEGWRVLEERYDDGGFSGATLERPALQKLLAGIEAGHIDCVVVYKVDRLSRSLLDFARLMELFDRHQVSFVSITQEFNTTTSLGRLTLNVLLSFAQFEREIISERTRDKLSAARRKGKWIGGTPILGYDVDPAGRRLVVNQSEARTVQQIYALYSGLGSLGATVRALQAQGVTTKVWTSRSGRVYPGRPFRNMSLRLLLSNVLYTGSVLHKGTVYAGEHEAIVDRQLWDTVSEKLKASGSHLRGKKHHRQDAPLAGLVSCGQCQRPLFATHTRKCGILHRYYVY
jgi:site-specific DNA recombinase